MKKYFLIILFLFTIIISCFSQSITPLETAELCPEVNITFTISIVAKSIQAVYPSALNIAQT